MSKRYFILILFIFLLLDISLFAAVKPSQGYHTFADVERHLNQLVVQYPELVELRTYGISIQEHPLYVLKVTDKLSTKQNGSKPELLFTSATHGDELITVEVLLGIIDELLEQHHINPRIGNILKNYDLYFIPVVNPDGFIAHTRFDNRLDPNRLFPNPEQPNRPMFGSIGPLINFFLSKNFVGSVDFHATGKNIMFPWSYTKDSVSRDHLRKFRALVSKMARSNGYSTGQTSSLWGIAKGASIDFYFWKKNTLAIGIEMGSEKIPAVSKISEYVYEQLESTWKFIEFF